MRPNEDLVVVNFATSEGWYGLYLFGWLAYSGDPSDVEWPECIVDCIAAIGRPITSARAVGFDEDSGGVRWLEDNESELPTTLANIPDEVWLSETPPLWRHEPLHGPNFKDRTP